MECDWKSKDQKDKIIDYLNVMGDKQDNYNGRR